VLWAPTWCGAINNLLLSLLLYSLHRTWLLRNSRKGTKWQCLAHNEHPSMWRPHSLLCSVLLLRVRTLALHHRLSAHVQSYVLHSSPKCIHVQSEVCMSENENERMHHVHEAWCNVCAYTVCVCGVVWCSRIKTQVCKHKMKVESHETSNHTLVSNYITL